MVNTKIYGSNTTLSGEFQLTQPCSLSHYLWTEHML